MIASSDWKKKEEEEEGIAISNLVNDSSFWKSVERVMKCTSPLVQGLVWFSSAKNQHVGCVYENLKDIKKSIAGKFVKEKQFYKPFLNVIDDTWKEQSDILAQANWTGKDGETL
ncbi:hypothetical protein V5N11_003466 [Cardamine amara subsp. amara]|uniref:Uncharacterized protein n=1 Tax=Cardamine amara subsp. amara TaxID=228776 RepID=A0ABD1C1R8_CARAN